MEFRELTDGEWEFIRPLLPPRAGTGRPRVDDRRILNGILYVLGIKGTKIRVLVSREVLPLSVQIGPGNKHDSKRFVSLLEDLRVKHGKGRPRTRGVVGDSAYDTKENREYLKRRGVKANIQA